MVVFAMMELSVQTVVEIAVGVVVLLVLFFVRWYWRRRSWSVENRDESMKRYVRRHYD